MCHNKILVIWLYDLSNMVLSDIKLDSVTSTPSQEGHQVITVRVYVWWLCTPRDY